MVVDDDEDSRSLLTHYVKALGYACREAADGEEAWASLEKERADIVLSDWGMPRIDGLELCKRLRRHEERSSAPYTYFMFMTSYRDKAHYVDGMHAGADDYLKKPLDLDEVEARLFSAARVVHLYRRVAARADGYRRESQRSFEIARTDPLTGIPNRLRMEEDALGALSRARRYGHPYSLSICDIDHFKGYNDSFGHPAGDEALRQVARVVRDHLRQSDGLYRYGGEEFLVLLPEQQIDDGRHAMERVRAGVEKELGLIQPTRGVTISAGVASVLKEDTLGSWIERADRALYRAKHAGRNRVESANAEDAKSIPPNLLVPNLVPNLLVKDGKDGKDGKPE